MYTQKYAPKTTETVWFAASPLRDLAITFQDKFVVIYVFGIIFRVT